MPTDKNPNLDENGDLIAWDSVCLGTLKDCPRKFYYSIIQGYRPKRLAGTPNASQTHLDFGSLLHKALERHETYINLGIPRETALEATVQLALEESRGLVAWKNKSRDSLIAAIVDYSDHYRRDPVNKTIRLSDGKVAAELSFAFEVGLDLRSWGGPESITFSGHIDRIVDFNGFPYVVDTKTTGMSIGGKTAISYFAGFNPNSQFSGYVFAAQELFGIHVRGVIVDAVQIAKTFTRCERGISQRTPGQIEEWRLSLGYWVGQARRFRQENYYPQVESACHKYNGCQFRSICSRDPHVREMFLQSNFERSYWNPLETRNETIGTIVDAD